MPSQAVIGAPGGVSTIAVSARASSRSVAVLTVHGFTAVGPAGWQAVARATRPGKAKAR